jgi:TonB family protein
VVATDGSVKKVEVLRGIHPALDAVAVRVVSNLPKWKPGRQNGQPVPGWFFIPVNFKLKYN